MDEVPQPGPAMARMTTPEFRNLRARNTPPKPIVPIPSWSPSAGAPLFLAGSALVVQEPTSPLLRHAPVGKVVVSDAETVQPIFVKAKKGVAHVVLRVGDVLLYVETQVNEMCAPARVWVLGKVFVARESLKAGFEPVTHRVATYLSPLVAKVEGAYTSAKSKAITVTLPFQTKIVDGVLYVQGTVGAAKIYIQARASNTWTHVAEQASSSYAMAYQAGDARVRPAWVWASSRLLAAKDAMLCTAQPYWIRARDGSLYIQTAIGNTFVRVQVSANDKVFAPVLQAFARLQGSVRGYTAQLLAKVVTLYDTVKARFLHTLVPFLEKSKALAAYTRSVVNDVVVVVKVRIATVRDRAQAHLSPVYMKFKNGFLYIHGFAGDKIIVVKVSLNDLVCRFTAKATELRTSTTARVVAAKAHIQDTGLCAAQFAKSKVDTLSCKVQVAVKDRGMQATAVGAVGGAASLGVGGGAAGLTTGSVIGAACGVPAALFTFGLSIPIGAALGGATGLCAGLVTGGAVGLLGGGATGRSVHKHSDEIKSGAAGALSKANGYKDLVAEKAKGYTNSVAETTGMMRARLVGGTGGSVAADSD